MLFDFTMSCETTRNSNPRAKQQRLTSIYNTVSAIENKWHSVRSHKEFDIGAHDKIVKPEWHVHAANLFTNGVSVDTSFKKTVWVFIAVLGSFARNNFNENCSFCVQLIYK